MNNSPPMKFGLRSTVACHLSLLRFCEATDESAVCCALPPNVLQNGCAAASATSPKRRFFVDCPDVSVRWIPKPLVGIVCDIPPGSIWRTMYDPAARLE